MGRWPGSFTQCILVSTRLRRWYRLHRRQSARPEVFRCSQGFVSRYGPGGDGLPRPGVPAGRDHGVGPAVSNGIVAFARIASAVCGDAADRLVRRDPAGQDGQDGRITDVAPGDLDRSDLQCLPVGPGMDPAPDTPLRTTVPARMPFAFAPDLDAGAVDQQVQRSPGATAGDVHCQGFPAARQRAEVRHCPVQAGQARQTRDEPGRRPERHAEQHPHRQARPDGGITVALPAATPA